MKHRSPRNMGPLTTARASAGVIPTQSQAAQRLGLSRQGLLNKLHRDGLR